MYSRVSWLRKQHNAESNLEPLTFRSAKYTVRASERANHYMPPSIKQRPPGLFINTKPEASWELKNYSHKKGCVPGLNSKKMLTAFRKWHNYLLANGNAMFSTVSYKRKEDQTADVLFHPVTPVISHKQHKHKFDPKTKGTITLTLVINTLSSEAWNRIILRKERGNWLRPINFYKLPSRDPDTLILQIPWNYNSRSTQKYQSFSTIEGHC